MTRDHLGVDMVADHLEGLLSPAATTHADRHLAHCSECASIAADLRALRAVLSEAPADPMPVVVAVRIDAALSGAWEELDAARAAVAATQTEVATARTGIAAAAAVLDTRDRSPRRRPSPRAPRRRLVPLFAAAAGTVGVVFAAILVGPQLTTGDTDDSGDAFTADVGEPEAADTDAGGEVGTEARGGDGLGTLNEDDAVAPEARESDGAFGSPVLVRSGKDYTAYTFSSGVGDLLVAEDLPSGFAAPDDPLAPLTEPSRLQACITDLTGTDLEPILVDLATFGGEPAAVIVLPNQADPNATMVFAVAPECGSGVDADRVIFSTTKTPKPDGQLTIDPPPTVGPDSP